MLYKEVRKRNFLFCQSSSHSPIVFEIRLFESLLLAFLYPYMCSNLFRRRHSIWGLTNASRLSKDILARVSPFPFIPYCTITLVHHLVVPYLTQYSIPSVRIPLIMYFHLSASVLLLASLVSASPIQKRAGTSITLTKRSGDYPTQDEHGSIKWHTAEVRF